MNRYVGIPCTLCGKPFTEQDDIVVCPECGAPHHRACYLEHGRCARAEHHAEGEWQPPRATPAAPAAAPAQGSVTCPSCGGANPAGAAFCQLCGARLGGQPAGQGQPYQRPPQQVYQYPPVPPVQPEDYYGGQNYQLFGVSVKELSAYVGNNFFSYLRNFQRMERSTSQISWNWAAFFFNFLYFFYRKMYLVGGVLLAFFAVTEIPGLLYTFELVKEQAPALFGVQVQADPAMMAMAARMTNYSNLLRFVMMVVCGMFANKIYLKKILKDIVRLRQGHGQQPSADYYNSLAMNGRTNFAICFMLVALVFMASVLANALFLNSIGVSVFA